MGKGKKAVFGERRQGNSIHMHHHIQDLMKNSRFIALGVIIFAVILNA